MVEQDLLDRFKGILAALEDKRGRVSIFAILKMDDITDRWTVFLSAPWINQADRGAIFSDLRDLILKNIEPKNLSSIARFGIFEPKEHLVELLLENFNAGDYIANDRQVNGNIIHEGYILALQKNLPKSIS